MQSLQRVGPHALGVGHQVVAFDDVQRGQRGGGGDGVLLMRVVAQREGTGHVEFIPRQAGRQRQHATAQRLAQHHDVGRRAVVFGGEEAAGLAQAGGNLVEDQQRAVRMAGLAHGLPVARGRDVGHGARGLGHHRGHVAFAFQHITHHRSASQAALVQVRLPLRVDRVAVGAAVAAEGGHVLAARQQRPQPARAEQRLAAHAAGAEAGTVERIPEAQRLEAARGGACKLERELQRVTSTGGEQHPAGLAGQRPKTLVQPFGQLHRTFGREAARREAQGVQLDLDGGDDVRMPMSDVVHVVAMEVHVAPAGQVLDEQAFGLGDGRQAGRGHRLVQEGRAVARQQRAAGLVQVFTLPGGAQGRAVDVALALRGVEAHATLKPPSTGRMAPVT
jgi:hypothetical protein